MTTDEKFDLILSKIGGLETKMTGLETKITGIETKMNTLESKVDNLENKLEGVEDAIVNVNKRLTIIEGDTHQLNLKIDEIRAWTRLDLKDNPFMKTRALA